MVSNVLLVHIRVLGESDLEHGHNSGEVEVVKTFNKRLVLINNCDVRDLIDLIKSLDSVLNKLREIDSGLHCI